MILYSLACEHGHRFESWFRDSAAFDTQAERDLVVCPICHSTHVAKTIMAPAVVGARKAAPRPVETAAENAGPSKTDPLQDGQGRVDKAVATDKTSAMEIALLDPRHRELAAAVKALREKVIADGQDVGARFPEEARRIHDGDAPPRQIYGQASLTEARELLEDGIAVLPLPGLPDDLN